MRTAISIRSLLFTLVLLAMSAASFGQVGISITVGPPPLPVYEQPLCPGEGFIWTPGYWAYDYDYNDYYWVPGTWVQAPEVGFFWTPGYWAWSDARFVFYEGYWGPQVGFYGGIDYGYGYFGNGYEGGRWDNGRFFYNRSVNNVNVTVIHNVYNTTVINRTTVNRVSYNGGNGGISVRPTREQEAVAHERHIAPVAAQTEHVRAARTDPEQRASVNHGKPAIAASSRPADFKDRVPAKEAGGPYTPQVNRGEVNRDNRQDAQRQENKQRNEADRPENNNRPANVVHPKDLPSSERPGPPNTGNARQDQKYQKDQEKLIQKQDQERQKLQPKQDQDHQKMERQKADDARKQQMEQQHQQQTQKMEHKQAQQEQRLQQKQQPKNREQPPPPK